MKLPKNFGGQNLSGALAQAQEAMARAQNLEAELADERIEVKQEVVTAVFNGIGELQSLKIDPEAVDPDDVDALEDMIVAAVKAGFSQATALRESKTREIMPNIPGMDKLGF